jgi:hypothetical protein
MLFSNYGQHSYFVLFFMMQMNEVAELKAAIAQKPAAQAYLNQFTDSCVESFINSYCTNRIRWIENANRNLDNREHHSIQWVSMATKHLGYLQQKKLFDAQCLWRAEQLSIPQIEVCYDFKIWEKDILNCPFIEPISEDDLALYTQYLLQVNPGEGRYGPEDNWQDHSLIINAYKTNNENWEFPEWYDFYNGRRGTGVYMTLPDIRGQKEDFYFELLREQGRKEREAQNIAPTILEPFKFLYYHDKAQRDHFVKLFEDKEVQSFYEAAEWSKRNYRLREDMDYYMYTLFNADEPVPIEANTNWSDAIIKASVTYTNQKIAAALPEAWEMYMMNIQMNIAFPGADRPFDPDNTIRSNYIKAILRGRELNGEPQDLNF